MFRHSPCRPVLEGGDGRILQHILGETDVAHLANQRRQDIAPLLADDSLDGRPRPVRCRKFQIVSHSNFMIGRISIDPCVADGILAAYSMASSRSLQSSR